MTLRRKTLTIISGTLILLMGMLFLLTQNIVKTAFVRMEKGLVAGFSVIEQKDSKENVERLVDALSLRINNLLTKAADWAMWDDTYRFVVDKNAAYIKSNFATDALGSIKLNMALIVDNDGEIVYATAYDLDKGKPEPVSDDVHILCTRGSKLLVHDSVGSTLSGIVLTKRNPLILVSRPIVKSDGTGPIRGSFIFGRYLDEKEKADLAAVTHLTNTLWRLDSAESIQNGDEYRKEKSSISDSIQVLIHSESEICGTVRIRDLFDRPALGILVHIPRTIYGQGIASLTQMQTNNKSTMAWLIVSILITGFVLGVVIVVILEVSVLSRVGRLSKEAAQIGSGNDFQGRVDVSGCDEIAVLSKSINSMLDALAKTHSEINEKNRELGLLMKTVPVGLLSLDEKFRINPEYSMSSMRLLGQNDLCGRDFPTVLGLVDKKEKDGAMLREYLDVFRMELLPEADMDPLNPLPELCIEASGHCVWLRLRYYLIRRDAGSNHLLSVIEDITEEKRLEDIVSRAQRENLQLKAIAENPDLFREFLSETKAIIDAVRKATHKFDTLETSLPLVNEVFRGVHTIKGVAGSFGLFDLAETASLLEERLSSIRMQKVLTAEDIRVAHELVAQLESVFVQIAENARKLLGDDSDHDGGLYLRVSLENIKGHLEDIERTTLDKVKSEVARRLNEICSVPASKGFARAIRVVPGLIMRLAKNVEFVFDGQDTPVHYGIASDLNGALVHLLRNAFDHGIETQDERIANKKTECGKVRFSVSRSIDKLILTLSDDGRGMDHDLLIRTAIKKGMLSEEDGKRLTKNQAFALIFKPGFSTIETISEVSGRGVGMDAVMTSVQDKLHGTIDIVSEKGLGTTFTITVPMMG